MIGAKDANMPKEMKLERHDDEEEPIVDRTSYQSLTRKLIYM